MFRTSLLIALALAATGPDALAQGLKVYISADMEGVAGAVSGDQLGPSGFEYGRFRQFMTDEVLAAVDTAIADSLATGTGLVGDISDTGRAVEPLARSPLRARVFHEVIAFDPRQAESALAEAGARLAAAEAVSSAAASTSVRHSLAPHAPHTVSARLLQLIRDFNGRDRRPTSMGKAIIT